MRKIGNLRIAVLGLALAAATSIASCQGRPDLVWMRGAIAGAPLSIAYSNDGKLIATGSASPDLAVKVWRLSDGMLLHTFLTKGNPVAVCFTPDSSSVLAIDLFPELVT